MKSSNRHLVSVAALGGLFAGLAPAADVTMVAENFGKRIEVSLQAYKDQSASIADEKIPLLREINQLEDDNLVLREKVKLAQEATAQNNTSFDSLRNRLEGLKAQTEFAQRFLREYLDSFESRIHTAEDQHYKGALTKTRLALDQPAADLGQRFTQELAALELGLKRAETAVGGYQFEGAAIAPGGVLKSGAVHVLGPAAVFSDVKLGGDTSGILRFHSGTIEPSVAILKPAQTGAIASFVQNRGGPLPLDASLGNAVALENSNVKIADHINNGGPVGYTIIVLGAVAVFLSAVKIFDLRRFRSIESDQLLAIVNETRTRNESGALALVKRISGPTGEMLEVGVLNARANLVLLEELMLSVILRRRPEAERFLPFLAITVVAAPLLGLLGTVVGMIRTFALITVFGTGDPRALSSGISEALITTEFGLMVAIPVLVVHSIFTRMIKSRAGDMERVAFEFVKSLALSEPEAKPAASGTPRA